MIKEIEIELETVRAMIKLYCINHHQGEWDLCDDCEGLFFAYTKSRVLQCPYLPTKPTCGGCKIHCYNQNYRSRIKKSYGLFWLKTYFP